MLITSTAARRITNVMQHTSSVSMATACCHGYQSARRLPRYRLSLFITEVHRHDNRVIIMFMFPLHCFYFCAVW